MLILSFVIKTIIDFYITILLLRSWLQLIKCNDTNPFVQIITIITNPFMQLLQYIIPSYKNQLINTTPIIIITLLLSILKYPLIIFIQSGILYISLGNIIMIGLIMLAKSIGFLILEIIIIHSLRSWMMQSYHPIDEILDKLTEHILNPVRDFIPVVWGIDFSPIIIVLILYIMNYLGMNLFPKMWNLI